MDPIRVLLVDDHAVVRAGIRALLEVEDDLTVVGEAGTGEEGVLKASGLRPDVVLMDLSMPGGGGLEATRRIVELGHGIRLLVLTVHGEEEYMVPVLDAGASGYITKQSADYELVEAIRTVASGNTYLYPPAARLLLQRFRCSRKQGTSADPLHVLSDREREVLTRIAEGFNAPEIGEQLGISATTVDTYRQRGMEKLDLRHRSELVRFALRTGLLHSPDPEGKPWR